MKKSGKEDPHKIIRAHLREKKSLLNEPESKNFLSSYGLDCVNACVATSFEEVIEFGKKIGYPIVMKVVSPEIIHKSDIGGVKLNIKDEREAWIAYQELVTTFKDRRIEGISVQKMAEPGIEVVVGVTFDETFDHVLMFGLGGIFVEVLKDVSFRVLPIDDRDAENMVREIKGYKILSGYRGKKADTEALKNLLLQISTLVHRFPQIREMDLNPVFVYDKGYKIVDARIILDARLQLKIKAKRKPYDQKNLRPFFYPKSIAVIGASNTEGKLGWNVFHNLLTHGYKGRLYPVNPNSKEIQGVKSFSSISDVPEKVDVAVLLVPADQTLQTIDECTRLGIKHFVIESAGFSELGKEGKRIQEELKSRVIKDGLRIIGPNCSGIINTFSGVCESIGVVGELKKGNIGLIAQAGVYAAGYLWGLRKTIDFGIIATIGNKVDVDETDVLDFLANEKKIKVICMYIEDVKDGKRFINVAKEVSRKKPVIILKTGRTEAGKKAVLSHTASLAGNDTIYEAAFKQAGIIRARDNEHMFALAKAFSKQPFPKRDSVFVVTYAGSLGVAVADAVVLKGLNLYEPKGEIRRELKKILPKFVSGLNPVDFTFDQTPHNVKSALEVVLKTDEVGGFIVILQTEKVREYIDTFKKIDFGGRPVMCVVVSKEFAIDDVIELENTGFPVYSTPEEAVDVLSAMYFWHSGLTKRKRTW
ncbi:MAG: acetate--CoA ligase family protein [Deltaproteobacteria bacterium]|nr:acetate--CoA ligase family protein [Deltaproteobacteria bacterium]